MIISALSIKRPVLAIVINLLIIILGVYGYINLPVREYPDVETPVVSVTTTYVGASAETIESSITEPLEQAINGIVGIRSVRSISSYGVSTINVEFQTSRELDDAANDVNNAIQATLGKIPQSADKPVVSKSTANSQALMWITLQGNKNKYSPEELTDIADRVVKTPLQILPGVGSVIIGGQRKYAMRIWLDPKKMVAHNIDAKDVRDTIINNNLQLPSGQIKGETRQFNVLANGQIDNPKIYEELIIKNNNGIPVRIRDIGSVELGAVNYDTIVRYNGKQVVGVGIIKQSKANELKVAEEIKKTLPKIKLVLPKDISLKISVDNSRFIKASLTEIKISLIIAFILVVIVTMFFLKSLLATLIVSVSIPISIVGTFFAMQMFGYSINVLTLLGLVLAIGLVIDDAIIVIENIYRKQEEGENKLQSAVSGSNEISFAVIATTISLISVFVPLSLLSGAIGRQFKEFAITVAISLAISGFVALTLIPTLCSKYLTISKKLLGSQIEDLIINLKQIYDKTLTWSINNQKIVLVFLVINIVFSIGFLKFMPRTSVPTEDRGLIVTFIKAPQGSTSAYTNHTQLKVEKEFSMIKEVDGYFSAIGLSVGGPANPSNGLVFCRLKPWSERNIKQQDIVRKLFPKFSQIPGALIFPTNPPSLGLGALSKDIELVIKSSSNLVEINRVSEVLLSKIKNIPGVVNVDSDLLINTPQLNILFDRERISDLGLSVVDISKSLQLLLSDGKINDFILRNKQYDVIASLYPKYKSTLDNLKGIYVKGKNGSIPLDTLVKITPTTAPAQINHYDLERSVTISANLISGYPLGNILEEINKITKSELPEGFSSTYSGISREYSESSSYLYFIFMLALIFVYLVLAGLFESFVYPLVILLSVPLALLGALITLFIFKQTLNLYTAIGIILLIGLVTKNAILIVEFANQLRAKGKDLVDAVFEAALVRFRPIIMTSIAMIFGNIPLVLAHGAGSESRQAMGYAIVGGLIFSSVFTLIVIPIVYIAIVKFIDKWRNVTT